MTQSKPIDRFLIIFAIVALLILTVIACEPTTKPTSQSHIPRGYTTSQQPSTKESVVVSVVNTGSIEYVDFGEKKTVRTITVRIKNNKESSTDIIVQKHALIYNDGTSQGVMVEGLINSIPKGCFGTLTDRSNTQPIPIFPSTHKDLTFCLSTIDTEKQPKFFISILYDVAPDSTSSRTMWTGYVKESTLSLSN